MMNNFSINPVNPLGDKIKSLLQVYDFAMPKYDLNRNFNMPLKTSADAPPTPPVDMPPPMETGAVIGPPNPPELGPDVEFQPTPELGADVISPKRPQGQRPIRVGVMGGEEIGTDIDSIMEEQKAKDEKNRKYKEWLSNLSLEDKAKLQHEENVRQWEKIREWQKKGVITQSSEDSKGEMAGKETLPKVENIYGEPSTAIGNAMKETLGINYDKLNLMSERSKDIGERRDARKILRIISDRIDEPYKIQKLREFVPESEFFKKQVEATKLSPTEGGKVVTLETAKNLPPVEEGKIRLYRAEGGKYKHEDLWKLEDFSLPENFKEGDSQFYTPEISYADSYRDSYSKGAKITYIDVPKELVNATDKDYEVFVNKSKLSPTEGNTND